ncbi:hypothetical protein U9R90_31845 [Streptomyces sp. E11-3]|uniref:hypothetical protein n=1 Tax=Streptomyces sp. E11-3 TaxID=3110112 RepID=UPI003980A964
MAKTALTGVAASLALTGATASTALAADHTPEASATGATGAVGPAGTHTEAHDNPHFHHTTDRWRAEFLNGSRFADDMTRGGEESPERISTVSDFTDSVHETAKQVLA